MEVSAEVVELDIDIDEPAMLPAESGAHAVAEHAPATEAELEVTPHDLMPSAPSVAPEPAGPAGNEVLEPEPSSSPRPIVSEAAAGFEETESAPRHTPPPESGKQVATPSAKPEPRKSAPPAEGLLGSLREPAARGRSVPAPPPEPSGIQPASFAPEVMRAELPSAPRVAKIEGAPPVFKPLSFGDLLDASLSL